MKNKSLFLALFGFCLLSAGTAFSQQDPPSVQCPVHEFWSGVELGWCASILHEGKTLGTVQEINFWIQRMYHAAELIEGANALCSKMNPAWPNWRFLQARLYRMCDDMIAICGGQNPNPWTTCPHLCESFWLELSGMMAGWSSALGEQMYDNPTRREQVSFGGCDIDYFKLGWRLAYAHYRLQADDRNTAASHLRAALQHLEQLREARPASGYCVELWHPGLVIPDINRVLDQGAARVTTRAAVDIIWNVMTTIERALNFGDAGLKIRRAPGTDDVLSDAGRIYLQGNSQGRRKTRPQITSIGSPQSPTQLNPPPAPPASAGRVAGASLGDELTLSEYGYTGKFIRQGSSDVWVGSWTGNRPQSTFRLAAGPSRTVTGITAAEVDIVLQREDRADYDLSPNLKAEYHLKATLQGSTIKLAGRRLIYDPGTKPAMAYLRSNVADVTGSATLKRP